jgi:uncharacterized protein YdhG (YjbR/CyaY superfamily)
VEASPLQTVDDYIAAQPEASRPRLQAIRAAIRKAMPLAEERIAYKIPAYRLDGRNLLYFAGWKNHLALYPTSTAMIAAMGDDLAPHRAAKDSLHFKHSQPLPVELIERIAAFRATEGYR